MTESQRPQSVNDRDDGPWYKQFWAWFVLAPLLIVMVAWIPFMTIAVKDADDVVIDNYYKEGRMINQRVDEDRHARELGLQATLNLDLDVGDVLLSLNAAVADYQLPETLTLYLDHPLEADNDHVITLHQIVPGRYRGELDSRLNYRWYVRLEPEVVATADGTATRYWRLLGELDLSNGTQLVLGSATSDEQ